MKYEIPEEETSMAKESLAIYGSNVSITNALWTLITSQAQGVQVAIKNRLDKLFSVDTECPPYTMEELLSRIEESEKQIEAGEVVTGEQVHQEMRDYVNSFVL